MPSLMVNVRFGDELRFKLKAIQRHYVLDGASEAVRLAVETFYLTVPLTVPTAPEENLNVAQVRTFTERRG